MHFQYAYCDSVMWQTVHDRAASEPLSNTVGDKEMAESLGLQSLAIFTFELDKHTLDKLRELQACKVAGADTVVSKDGRGRPLKPSHIRQILAEDGWLNDEMIDRALNFTNVNHIWVTGGKEVGRATWKTQALLTEWDRKMIDGTAADTSAARWLRKVGITRDTLAELDCIMVPCQEESHWKLTLIFLSHHRVAVLDSLATGGVIGGARTIYKRVCRWLGAQMKDDFDERQWSLVQLECPQQQNLDDCGIHVALNAFCISKGFWPMAHNAVSPASRRRFVAFMVSQGDGDVALGRRELS